MPTLEEKEEKLDIVPSKNEQDDYLDYFEDEKARKPKGKKILKMRKNW
jgi:hypothetical protein